MVNVVLELADGTEVAQVVMPRFLKLPEVVVWGTRTFTHHHQSAAAYHYREVFGWWAPGYGSLER